MDIPYTVTARKDTGLYNAKVGIWLFLASEVMLFGGLFSGYVFLRVYADFPWPERALPVVPGLINTFVLIGSSVTVVFAWASLKMRKWRQFQVFMIITLLCAGLFMILKGIEYKAKWTHQAVRMKDFVVVEGHTHKATIDKDGHIHHYHPEGHEGEEGHAEYSSKSDGLVLVAAEGESSHSEDGSHGKKPDGKPFELNRVVFKTESVTIDLEKFYDPVIRDLMDQSQKQSRSIVLQEDIYGRTTHKEDESILAEKGDLLSLGMLKKLQAVHLDAKAHNASIRTKQNREAWATLRASLPKNQTKVPSYKIKDDLVLNDEFNRFIIDSPSSVRFSVMAAAEGKEGEMEPSTVTLVLKPREVREGAESATLKDATLLTGEFDSKHSQIEMAADAIDFRFVAQRAEEKGIDPELAIQNTWIIQNNPEVKELWARHKAHIDELAAELKEEHGIDKKTGKAKFIPTDTERYRMGWQELVNMGEGRNVKGVFSGFAGPNHTKDYAKHFPEVVVPREETNLESKFTPHWNNYYAIYFLITGLHGLHVIGGALVLGHFLFFGKKMYLNNPERLANRVEVGGLFWHFVDLVWIFLFPILYLM